MLKMPTQMCAFQLKFSVLITFTGRPTDVEQPDKDLLRDEKCVFILISSDAI